MPGTARSILTITGQQSGFRYGPFPFDASNTYDELLIGPIVLAATSLLQLIGGTNPAVGAIVTVQYLLLAPDQQIQIGMNGVSAQSGTNWFTCPANGKMLLDTTNTTQVQIYNTAAVAANIFVAIGGKAT